MELELIRQIVLSSTVIAVRLISNAGGLVNSRTYLWSRNPAAHGIASINDGKPLSVGPSLSLERDGLRAVPLTLI